LVLAFEVSAHGRLIQPHGVSLALLVPEAGDEVEIDGKKIFIPEGTNIGWCVWGITMNRDIFGEDANIFRPERWLVDDTDKQNSGFNF